MQSGACLLYTSTGSQHNVKQLGLVGVGACGTDADDVLNAVLAEQLIRINTDGRHTHAAAHHADGAALVGAGIAKHTAHIGDDARVLEKSLGNEFSARCV